MMSHAAILWPGTAEPQLWPLAVDYVAHIYNRTPPYPSTGFSPLDVMSGTKQHLDRLHDLHVFGCPTYVLDPTLSDAGP